MSDQHKSPAAWDYKNVPCTYDEDKHGYVGDWDGKTIESVHLRFALPGPLPAFPLKDRDGCSGS